MCVVKQNILLDYADLHCTPLLVRASVLYWEIMLR